MNANTVRVRTNDDGSYTVVVLKTGDALANFDSLFLAKQMVCRINRNLDK